ncbi:protein of unknown function [Xenorhabdus doucetiae]|uniref:Uncharacterized protein n=1 Tax=Xenorhabdus doucetiae TaxID=351671 RepID=A0A068QND8_9GAMM|nr:protein of unknown function [Xenorhabdus doucetiae]
MVLGFIAYSHVEYRFKMSGVNLVLRDKIADAHYDEYEKISNLLMIN